MFKKIRQFFYVFQTEEVPDTRFAFFISGFVISAFIAFVISFIVGLFTGTDGAMFSLVISSFRKIINYTYIFIFTGICFYFYFNKNSLLHKLIDKRKNGE